VVFTWFNAGFRNQSIDLIQSGTLRSYFNNVTPYRSVIAQLFQSKCGIMLFFLKVETFVSPKLVVIAEFLLPFRQCGSARKLDVRLVPKADICLAIDDCILRVAISAAVQKMIFAIRTPSCRISRKQP